MNTILSFIIGLVLGSWFGVGLYALLVANEDDNDDEFHHNETGY